MRLAACPVKPSDAGWRRSLFSRPLEGTETVNHLSPERPGREGGPFLPARWIANMALTPEQHLEIASAYESAASDASLPEEQRARFAKKAESFRLLAKLAAKQTASARQRVRTPIDASELRRQIFEHLEKKRSTPNPKRLLTSRPWSSSPSDGGCSSSKHGPSGAMPRCIPGQAGRRRQGTGRAVRLDGPGRSRSVIAQCVPPLTSACTGVTLVDEAVVHRLIPGA